MTGLLTRFWNLLKGFFGQFLTNAEKQNPEVLLELEVENLRKQISRYNQGLISHAALCERLMTRTGKLKEEQQSLNIKIPASIKAGNREAAGQQALRLQHVEQELADTIKQSEQAESTYKDLVKGRDTSVAIAKAKIESIKSGISDMRMHQAVAEMSEMASSLVSDIGGAGDTMDRLSTMVEEEREKAVGKARVAKDTSNVDALKMNEDEQVAIAEQALQAFEAKGKKTAKKSA